MLDNPYDNSLNKNKDMTISSNSSKTTPDPKKDKIKKRNGFMTGNRKDKQGDMEGVAAGIKGAQMLIKTLFPSDEPIPRRN